MRFTVGLKLKAKADHIVVEAEDALIAALKVKTDQPEARIMYVRPSNRRGDARHPANRLATSSLAASLERCQTLGSDTLAHRYFANALFISAPGAASAKPLKLPSSMISLAVRMNPPQLPAPARRRR